VLVTAESVDAVFKTILESARTGQLGDGKIFVQDIEKVTRIRTGEEGREAI